MAADEMIYDLPHGVRLSVRNPSGRLTIRDVADGLAEALRHFKHHRDVLKTGAYAVGPYTYRAARGRKETGIVCLTSTSEAPLTAALWTEAVIRGYVEANTLEQMIEQLPAYRAAAKKEGGWLVGVLQHLVERGGDLRALRAMLERTAIGQS